VCLLSSFLTFQGAQSFASSITELFRVRVEMVVMVGIIVVGMIGMRKDGFTQAIPQLQVALEAMLCLWGALASLLTPVGFGAAAEEEEEGQQIVALEQGLGLEVVGAAELGQLAEVVE
jgi:hypothetical protein